MATHDEASERFLDRTLTIRDGRLAEPAEVA
jgi:ABC-type lipoprotein export system ATPase subunit